MYVFTYTVYIICYIYMYIKYKLYDYILIAYKLRSNAFLFFFNLISSNTNTPRILYGTQHQYF